MSNDFDQTTPGYEPTYEPPEVTAKKDNKKWIIIAIVVVVLCCCCAAIGGGAVWLWNNGDSLIQDLGVTSQIVGLFL